MEVQITQEFVTPQELGRRLRVHERTVIRQIKAGRLQGVRIGRCWRISKAAADAWIAAGGTQIDTAKKAT